MANQISKRSEEQDRAKTIQSYWASRGYRVKTWLVPLGPSSEKDTEGNDLYVGFCVQSNMKDGLPIELWESKSQNAEVQ